MLVDSMHVQPCAINFHIYEFFFHILRNDVAYAEVHGYKDLIQIGKLSTYFIGH
jgi:hypothetical protein